MLDKPRPLLPLRYSERRRTSEGLILRGQCLCSGSPTLVAASLAPPSPPAGLHWLAAAPRKESPASCRTSPRQPRTARRPGIQTPGGGGETLDNRTGSEGGGVRRGSDVVKFSHQSGLLQLGATVVCGEGDGGNEEEHKDDTRIHKVLGRDTGRLA